MSASTEPLVNPAQEQLWTKNFILITAVNFLIFCSFQMFPTALPPYLRTLGISDSMIGWMVGIPSVVTVLVRPFAGTALDKIGRKPVIFTGIVIMLIATAGHWVQAFAILFLMRSLTAVGFGIANTASNTIASENIPKSRFGEGMGYFGLFGTLAMAISPWGALEMMRPAKDGSISITPVVVSALAFLIVAIALSVFVKTKAIKKTSVQTTGNLTVAAGATQSAKIATPKKKVSPYEKNAFLPAVILFLLTGTYGAVITFLALHAGTKGIENIGLYFTVYSITLLFTRPYVGKFVDRRGYGAAIVPGVILVIAGLVVLWQAETIIWFYISAVLYGAGQGAAQTSAQTMAVAGVARERLGAANATYFTGFDAGVGFGSVAGGLIAAQLGYGLMYAILAVLPFIAAVLYLYSSHKRKQKIVA